MICIFRIKPSNITTATCNIFVAVDVFATAPLAAYVLLDSGINAATEKQANQK